MKNYPTLISPQLFFFPPPFIGLHVGCGVEISVLTRVVQENKKSYLSHY